MNIVFFHRKPKLNSNYSVENIFNSIRTSMPPKYTGVKFVSRYTSNGIWKRFFNIVESFFYQGDVNHITGEVYFLSFLLSKKRTLITFLDVGFMYNSKGLRKILLKYFWIIFPIKKAAVIVAISETTKKELLKYVDIEEEKIRVIHVPISNIFQKNFKEFNSSNPYILQIGIAPNKNLNRLIDALQGINCHLEIVGKPDVTILDKLSKSNFTYNISYNLQENEILEKYNSSDIVSLISTYEGFGMPIIEANAIGRVVITSNISSMPEVANNAAHFVNPFDTQDIRSGILRLIRDVEYRNLLITNGFENRKRFSIPEITKNYCLIYDEIIEKF